MKTLEAGTTMEQKALLGYSDNKLLKMDVKRNLLRLSSMECFCIKWDIIAKTTGSVIGNCGFHNWYKEHQRAEIGYLLHEPYRGQGFMSESLHTILTYGFHYLDLNRIEAYVSPSNLKSIQVLSNIGFKQEGILSQHYKNDNGLDDSLLFSLLKVEYNVEI